MKTLDELRAMFGTSTDGNFCIHRVSAYPHDYCIGSKHIEWAAEHFNSKLNREAVISLETAFGPSCAVHGCNLTFAEHEPILVIGGLADLTVGNDPNPELHEWLLSINDAAIAEGFKGYAFVDLRGDS